MSVSGFEGWGGGGGGIEKGLQLEGSVREGGASLSCRWMGAWGRGMYVRGGSLREKCLFISEYGRTGCGRGCRRKCSRCVGGGGGWEVGEKLNMGG